jgi:hypothetical protein
MCVYVYVFVSIYLSVRLSVYLSLLFLSLVDADTAANENDTLECLMFVVGCTDVPSKHSPIFIHVRDFDEPMSV